MSLGYSNFILSNAHQLNDQRNFHVQLAAAVHVFGKLFMPARPAPRPLQLAASAAHAAWPRACAAGHLYH